MASGIAGTSMIFASLVFHCAPNMADPSNVIRSTIHTGGSDGAMAGCGAANGRTGVAAMMTGGATRWCCVDIAAPLTGSLRWTHGSGDVVWACVTHGDGHGDTARPKALQWTHTPMTLSCIG